MNEAFVPTFSVVVCTYNRADRVGRAITSVLRQTLEDFELIVVDDGSVDATSGVVTAIGDPRLRYVYRENGGLSAARNTGVASSSGKYVTFLDDDDEALPRWLEKMECALAGDDAVATCAAYTVNVHGRVLETMSPKPLGPAYDDYQGLFLAGTFALPRRGYVAIGGFAEAAKYCQHSELALRLLPYCRASNWPVRVIEEPLLRWEARPLRHRPAAAPEHVLLGMEYLLAHHHARLSRSPEALSNCHAQAGVAAVRLGRYPEARRHFALGARAQPRNVRHWLRLGIAMVPPLGNRVWRAGGFRYAVVRGIRRSKQRLTRLARRR
jgi:glycosyltransferase involved in cell wall biosynthesis